MKRLLWALAAALLLLTGCQFYHKPSSTLQTVPYPSDTSAPTETEIPLITEAPTETIEVTQPTEPIFDPYRLMENMRTEELVGQLFLARCPTGQQALNDLQTYHLGGYILFGRDFEGQTPDSMTQIITSYQQSAKIPMLIAVDEEGGTVCRVSNRTAFREKRFPSPRKLYDAGGMELLLQTEAEKAQLLHSLGINVNMAPVCDITTDSKAFMYSRSLGQDPETTGQCIAAMAQAMHQESVGSVLKHFPGYGNNTDTHVGIVTDSRSLDELENNDLLPFRAGIEAGAGAVLVSHTIIECLDAELPASLSPSVITYLRDSMGFDGVIVTDDLVMQAITDRYGDGEAAVLAVLAGNDLLCSSEYAIQYAAVLDAVTSGRISEEHLKTAVARILQWKYELGLVPIL